MAIIRRNGEVETPVIKERKLREIKLSDPVMKYFEEQGNEVYTEICIPTSYRCCDLIALKGDIVTAIELKVSLTRQVFHQAYGISVYVDYIWVAVGTNPRSKNLELCKRAGIGVLSCKNGTVHVIQKPEKGKAWDPVKEKLLERLKKYEPGGIAGYPVQKGVGPAIECHRLVGKYKIDNPKATWKEVYDNIPNHYASPASMASSMSKITVKNYFREKIDSLTK